MISWHRFYDPSTGRYITADPIGLAGGINLYAYVGGNPVNLVDPEGLAHRSGRWKDCGGGCRIRIDYDATGEGRHLHWECKGGKSGVGGENGGTSHGSTLANAPRKVKKCAKDQGFEPDGQSEFNIPECNDTCQVWTKVAYFVTGVGWVVYNICTMGAGG